jgi:hypothetical protein
MMHMKHTHFAAIASLAFAACAFPLMADEGPTSRASMIEFAERQIRSLSAGEAPAGELGEWKDILDAALFLLIRTTEVSREPIRVLVVNDESAIARMYPDGTFVASTGLFDYIDRTLFEEAAMSSRRVRDFESERETMLAPFLAFEVARYALDQQYAAWKRSRGAYLDASAEESREADRFSAVLLDLCGYGERSLDALLARLEKTFAEGSQAAGGDGGDTTLRAYFSAMPSPALRRESIASSTDEIGRVDSEFSGVLATLKYGMPVKGAQESLASLAERYPSSPYVARLSAVAAHMRWLESVSDRDKTLPVFFPIATVARYPAAVSAFPDASAKSSAVGSGNRIPYVDIARTKRSTTATAVFSALPVVSAAKKTPGDADLWRAALAAYDASLALADEAGLASSRASLLAYGGTSSTISLALSESESAALRESTTSRESANSSFTARANRADILFLTGADYGKAQYTLESLTGRTPTSADTAQTGARAGARNDAQTNARCLESGSCGDGRDLILAHAIMLRLLGETARADSRAAEAETLYRPTLPRGTIDLRRVRIGDTMDTLAERWGRPASILYDYYTEIWEYPSIAASVMVGKNVEEVRVGKGSPVSPGGDVRCGDRREELEAVLGKSAYRAGDCDAYVKDGNRVSVLYLAGRIRFMTFGL